MFWFRFNRGACCDLFRRLQQNSAANFQIVLGTDNVMQWWFIATIPVAFILLAARVFENMSDDIARWRKNEPLIQQAVIGGDV